MGGTGNSMCKASDMGPSLVGVRNRVTWRHRGDVKSVARKAAVAVGTGRMGPGHTFHVTWLAGETQGASRWVVGLVRRGVAMAWGGGLGGMPRGWNLDRGVGIWKVGADTRPDGKVAKAWVWGRPGSQDGHGSRGRSSGEGLGLEVRTEVGQCGAGLQTPIPGAWLAGRRPRAPSGPR